MWQITQDMQANDLENGTVLATTYAEVSAMTNRAEQNWPDEETYDITSECAAEYDALPAANHDRLLGCDHRDRAVESHLEHQMAELITLVNNVMEVRS